jgi:hypothetical protein
MLGLSDRAVAGMATSESEACDMIDQLSRTLAAAGIPPRLDTTPGTPYTAADGGSSAAFSCPGRSYYLRPGHSDSPGPVEVVDPQ